jgi:hypothetical protein
VPIVQTLTLVTLHDRLASLRLAAKDLDVRPVDEAPRGRADRARLAFNGTTAVKFAYLDAPEQRGLPLRLYPADTLEQARVFYASPARVQRTLALGRRGWELEPKFHFGYRERGLCWGTMATIGRGAAVVQALVRKTMKGLKAQLAWGTVHLALLPTNEDRAKAVVEWAGAGMTHQRTGRITVTAGSNRGRQSP